MTVSSSTAYAWCREVTRVRARNFYYGLKLLPEPKRSALYAIYAWMRMADDLIDEATDVEQARAELARFDRDTTSTLHGTPPSDEPMWIAMADVATNWTLDPECFSMMIAGQAADLQSRTIESPSDLITYCNQVASSVGLVCIDIWGYTDPAARELAIERGIAFQLTNILRDLREDLELGRCYLPAEQLRAAHVSTDDLLAWRHNDVCEALVGCWIDRAQQAYTLSAPLDDMIDRACRPTLWAMTTIYHSLLEKIAHEPRCVVGEGRVRLSPIRKSMVALQARWQAARS
jgi:phytoene synthase